MIHVAGFQFSGVAAGIKETDRLDLALIRSDPPAMVAGAFTTNRVQAAPVLVSRRNIRSGLCSAVIINSGNANACTGRKGLRDALMMVGATAKVLQAPPRQILVCSTGKIGVPLPIDRIARGIRKAAGSLAQGAMMTAARAILTTDKGPKIACAAGKIRGKRFHLAGFAKGAGMIEPHLAHSTHSTGSGQAGSQQAGSGQATMLAFFMTDLALTRSVLSSVFRSSIEESFNRITVDGDTSTNDTVFLLANGLAGNKPIEKGAYDERKFSKTLRGLMQELALKIVEDGEGATKCVGIEVKRARSVEEARRICYAIGNSPLVKTSFYGGDPNWGRILAAIGRSGTTRNPQNADIYYNEVCVARKGLSTGARYEAKARKVMEKKRFSVTIDLHDGKRSSWIWTSDLTEDYVKLNSNYRT